MKNQSNHPSNFWFGFALGTISTAAVAYLLGTDKGRTTLKKVIETAEHFEGDSPDLLIELNDIYRSFVNDTPLEETLHKHTTEAKEISTEPRNSIETVMDKIKNAAQHEKHVTKFFSKNGKIVSE